MNQAIALVVVATVGLAVLEAAGPTVVAIANASWPLLLVAGLLAILARIVWYWTNRW